MVAGGVVDARVMSVELPGKHGTRLMDVGATGDDGLRILLKKLFHMLHGTVGDVGADLLHHLDGDR